MLKLLSKEPSSRYRNADQLGRVLVTFVQQTATVGAIPLPAFPEAEGDEYYSPPSPDQTRPMPYLATDPPPYEVDIPHTSTQPASAYYDQYPPAAPRSAPVAALPEGGGFDWFTWLLGLLALIAVGGLIPFCLWVYYIVYPPL